MLKMIFSLLVAVVIFAGCNSSTEVKKDESSMTSEKAINVTPDKLTVKRDPVCGMSMESTPIADTMTYKGNLYGFCNPGCKKDFKENPEKYLAEMPKE